MYSRCILQETKVLGMNQLLATNILVNQFIGDCFQWVCAEMVQLLAFWLHGSQVIFAMESKN